MRDVRLMEITQLIITGIAALGTVSVAVLAIWGNWFRAKLAPAELRIEPHNLEGDLTHYTSLANVTFTGPNRVYYYHLKVVNKRPWITPKNCRVLSKAMAKRGPDGEFHEIPMQVPQQFVWAPAQITPPVISIEHEQILDFGKLNESNPTFVPVLYSYSNNFEGQVGANEAVRYSLQIVSDSFVSPNYHVFEVSWNGKWTEDKSLMTRSLIIKEVKD